MMRPMLIVALLATATPGVSSAQETARSRAREALPSAVFEQMADLAAAAETDGIPGELLFNKALEGAAKRVPSDRLIPAVEAYADRLRQARLAFGPEVGAPLLVAGADALQRGVDAESLRELGERQERSPTAVLVLAELVEAGVPTDRALELLREARRLRAHDREVLDVSARVRHLMRQGVSAHDAADRVRRALRRGRGSGVGPPVPPGSEPLTSDRLLRIRRIG